jgi:uncharacterized protein YuzE
MKLKYIEETDTFYFILNDKKSVESGEIANNVIADFDELGNIIGIEILSAKSKLDFSNLQFELNAFEKVI